MRDAPLVGDPATFVQDTRSGHEGHVISPEDPAALRAITRELTLPFVQRSAAAPFDDVVADAVPGRLRPVSAALGSGTSLTWVVPAGLLAVLDGDGMYWWSRRRS
jgi:hypothetical protein